jgi:hypothetical protein
MMTTTTYGFRAEEERMNAADDRADARMSRETRVWNALQDITRPALRESAYDALSAEIDDGEFTPGWFQVGPYVVGVADESGETIAVYKILPHQQSLIGIDALAQRPGEIGVEGGFIYHEPIGNALCHARFHDGEFLVDITTAE